jgi:O-antigen ligase
MSEFAISSKDARSRAIDTDGLVRGILFVAILLLVWISPHPFQSLADPPATTSDGGDRINQIVFSLVFLTLGGWAWLTGFARLKPILRPIMILTIAWFALSVLTSWDPSLSARRFVFTMMVVFMAAVMLLLPRNLRHFADLVAIATVAVLALCYMGLLLAPQLAIHQATDFLEPEHAGSWRGVFPHKNQAGAMMAIFVFVGLFVARMRSRALGVAIVAVAVVFLVMTRSKTSIGLLPLTLLLTWLITQMRRPLAGVVIAAGTVAAFNLFSIGSVYFDSVQAILQATMSDPSFTGRSDIWKFALGELASRPITGFGFGAFWGTERVVFGLSEQSTWAIAATDAHNGYLNLAITTGVPGLALAAIWLVGLPLFDFYRRRGGPQGAPLAVFFLRVWIFGLLAACFESTLFPQVGELWFIFIMAVFGLRYLAQARATA